MRFEFCVRCASVRGRRQLQPATDGLGPGWEHRSARACARESADHVQLGNGMFMSPFTHRDGGFGGFIFWHRRIDSPSGLCGGAIPIAPLVDGGAHWTMASREPLTLSPSILCQTQAGAGWHGGTTMEKAAAQRVCGVHGFVTSGVWLPA